MSERSSAPSSAEAWAVVATAGRGARFGAGRPKQFQPVAGQPLLWWTLQAFRDHPALAGSVLVLPQEAAASPPPWLQALLAEGDAPLRAVAGGATRAESVAAGLRALPSSAAWVVVHDGVRPCVQREWITAALRAAQDGGVAAVVGRPETDTLKAVGDDGAVRTTVGREGLWRAETPQAFPRAMLERAYAEAGERAAGATDCSALCEAIGARVVMVEAAGPNPKVTTAADLAWIEAWLRRPRGDDGEG